MPGAVSIELGASAGRVAGVEGLVLMMCGHGAMSAAGILQGAGINGTYVFDGSPEQWARSTTAPG
ncbi:MAG TPA: hypothetical protein VFQ96_03610, partial [Microbacteriaceae bacterium]|nr:hypothetical protein [Microbacteriaceae bacterium]